MHPPDRAVLGEPARPGSVGDPVASLRAVGSGDACEQLRAETGSHCIQGGHAFSVPACTKRQTSDRLATRVPKHRRNTEAATCHAVETSVCGRRNPCGTS